MGRYYLVTNSDYIGIAVRLLAEDDGWRCPEITIGHEEDVSVYQFSMDDSSLQSSIRLIDTPSSELKGFFSPPSLLFQKQNKSFLTPSKEDTPLFSSKSSLQESRGEMQKLIHLQLNDRVEVINTGSIGGYGELLNKQHLVVYVQHLSQMDTKLRRGYSRFFVFALLVVV